MAIRSGTKSDQILIRVTGDLKKAAEDVLGAAQLSTSEAIRLFLLAVVVKKGMPFDVNICFNGSRHRNRRPATSKRN